MKKIILTAVLVVLMGCSQEILIEPVFNTVDDVFKWVIENIEYTLDKEDSWQSPQQTYNLKSGHCSDMALLEMYFLNEMNIESEMYWVRFKISFSDNSHALVLVKNETIPRNSTSLSYITPSCYEIIRITSYKQSLEYAERIKTTQ
ncbi:MAG TPA: hypothetical protein ENH49_06975 [Candidatus Marinimicrobia bacterium]|nr:hypothetical protein [Candidatus Neomarinimicrobiota bacterium]